MQHISYESIILIFVRFVKRNAFVLDCRLFISATQISALHDVDYCENKMRLNDFRSFGVFSLWASLWPIFWTGVDKNVVTTYTPSKRIHILIDLLSSSQRVKQLYTIRARMLPFSVNWWRIKLTQWLIYRLQWGHYTPKCRNNLLHCPSRFMMRIFILCRH